MPDTLPYTPPEALHFAEIHEVASLIADRSLSPVALTEAMLSRIAALDPELHSYAHVAPEAALAEARAAEALLERGTWLGPLHGIPLGIKDIFRTKRLPTAAGTTMLSDYVPEEDCTVVARFRAAGAVILGKLQQTEGAYSAHHPDITVPVNPWGSEIWSGASSSGSGVAVAAGLCFGATGSDTGGSIRLPSAANGLTGIKPSWGRVSRAGIFELAASMDHMGPMARSTRDAAILLAAMAGVDDRDPTSSTTPVPDYPTACEAGISDGLAGLRIGIDRRWNSADVDPTTCAALAEAEKILVSLGAVIVEVETPDPSATIEGWTRHCGVETAVAHEATYPARASEYGPVLAELIELGRATSAMEYQKLLLARAAYTGALNRVMAGLDLLLVPAQPVDAPSNARMAGLGGDGEDISTRIIRYTAPFDMSGHPTITLPCGQMPGGAPLGMQLVAGHFREALLCRAGAAFQTAVPWHRRHPTLTGA